MKSHQIVSISPASDDLSQPIDDYHAISTPKPPAALSREAKNWWREIVTEYGIADSGGLLLLRTALEALDRMRQAQKAIKKDGATVLDRFEQPKPHPLLTIERDSACGNDSRTEGIKPGCYSAARPRRPAGWHLMTTNVKRRSRRHSCPGCRMNCASTF